MRVISGKAKGKKLQAPQGKNTRPITDMIKEALFNVLGKGIINSTFLDLFAGSGSVGIEALSRGALKAVFVDSNLAAIRAINNNLTNCRLADAAEVYRSDVFRLIEIFEKKLVRFDYIYVDPPFDQEHLFDKVMVRLGKGTVIDPEGTIIIRTHRKKAIQDTYNVLSRFRQNRYGESVLHYYALEKEEMGYDGNLPGS